VVILRVDCDQIIVLLLFSNLSIEYLEEDLAQAVQVKSEFELYVLNLKFEKHFFQSAIISFIFISGVLKYNLRILNLSF